MQNKFIKPISLRGATFHYCSGCGHGILHRLVAEVIDEIGIKDKVIGVAPVGCAVIAYEYWDFDVSEAAHGRALAVATGIKRCRPQNIVFTYQGDGDLVSIGMAESFHAANRGENLTCIFVNNACYGMTGGQMAPTTLVGQQTLTTPWGRNPKYGEGWPIRFSEILANLSGVNFAVRCALSSPKEIINARQHIKKAFLNQIENKGFSIVEVLSPCPTIWQKKPVDAMKWIDEEMVKTFPLGIIKGK